jgi:hypothetical protein
MAATFARILFVLALLSQALSAPLGGRSAHAAGGEAARLCVLSHADASASSSLGDSFEQGPRSDRTHRHGDCAFCEFGASGAPLPALGGRFDAPVSYVEATRIAIVFASAPFSRDDSNAPTRAPPSFS